MKWLQNRHFYLFFVFFIELSQFRHTRARARPARRRARAAANSHFVSPIAIAIHHTDRIASRARARDPIHRIARTRAAARDPIHRIARTRATLRDTHSVAHAQHAIRSIASRARERATLSRARAARSDRELKLRTIRVPAQTRG